MFIKKRPNVSVKTRKRGKGTYAVSRRLGQAAPQNKREGRADLNLYSER